MDLADNSHSTKHIYFVHTQAHTQRQSLVMATGVREALTAERGKLHSLKTLPDIARCCNLQTQIPCNRCTKEAWSAKESGEALDGCKSQIPTAREQLIRAHNGHIHHRRKPPPSQHHITCQAQAVQPGCAYLHAGNANVFASWPRILVQDSSVMPSSAP